MWWPFGRATDGTGRPFVIVFPGRTGSSWLVSALAEHPAVEAQGEILVRRSRAEQSTLIRAALAPRGRRRARGFKTKMKDVADPAALRLAIEEREALVIHMRRDDRLRLALSRINARRLHDATGRWNRTAGTERDPDATPVTVEELHRAFESNAEEVARVDAFVASLTSDVLEIRYADILRDAAAVLDRTQRAVRIEPRPLRSKVIKNTDEDVRPIIPDLTSMAARFADTPFAAAFDIDPARES